MSAKCRSYSSKRTSCSTMTRNMVAAVAVVLACAFALSAEAQRTGAEAGSPAATTTISGKQLPAPEPRFGGVINEVEADTNDFPTVRDRWSDPFRLRHLRQ